MVAFTRWHPPPPLSHTQELLTKHKALAAEVLEANYDKVCAAR